jgi:hypothetical protein
MYTGIPSTSSMAGPQRRDQGRMTCQYAQVALAAGQVDLVDVAGKQELLGRDEIEV